MSPSWFGCWAVEKQKALGGLVLIMCERDIHGQRVRGDLDEENGLRRESQNASSPSSSPPSSADDSEAANSSFHFFLFLGGGSALGLDCFGRGFWLWATEEGGAVKPSKVFIWTLLCGRTTTVHWRRVLRFRQKYTNKELTSRATLVSSSVCSVASDCKLARTPFCLPCPGTSHTPSGTWPLHHQNIQDTTKKNNMSSKNTNTNMHWGMSALTYTVGGRKHSLSISQFRHKFLQQSLLDFPDGWRFTASFHCHLAEETMDGQVSVQSAIKWQ